ncbi:putative transcriptional regulator [Halobacteroides halobius DSM 5150]|uniref:Putative transcriptional regulator n=1 Tax=Halobacteroides halobius (strain ATCC 35273 / DSM 5150 / MD-1) TaxID=748449 RepID=L0K818_HALHC|nr:metalloregulator ArsR/SmtB family transcription factor [Halobacteroides halobius]AGB41412.1 putative transcriptional regulator [Halobacteroides halobius DSM 5150]
MSQQTNTTWQENFAQLSKALGHPHRIKIIQILADLPADNHCMVSSIVDQLPISQSTVSQHLKILKKSGWIKGRIDGPRVCYCLEEGIFDRYKKLISNIEQEIN